MFSHRVLCGLTTASVSPYIDLWALGIMILQALDMDYCDKVLINRDELRWFEEEAFGLGPEGIVVTFEKVSERCESIARFFSPIIHHKSYLSTVGPGKVDAATYGTLLQGLLAAPRVRCEYRSKLIVS